MHIKPISSILKSTSLIPSNMRPLLLDDIPSLMKLL